MHRPQDHYLPGWCRALADALDGFRYTPLVLAVDETAPEIARRAAAALVAAHPDIARYDVYAAGPEPVMGSVRELLAAHGLPDAQLRVDRLEYVD